MEILFMVFMVVVSIMALFAVAVVFRDILKEILAVRKDKNVIPSKTENASPVATENKCAAVEAELVPEVAEPASEQTSEEEAEEQSEAQSEKETVSESTISFSMGQQQTLEEKYLALPAEQRRWYDEIIKYASAVEGSKRFKNARYEEYKVGKNRIVRLLIKRGIINCEFILHNSDFKNYINENKISVRQSATTMLVESSATVDAVKNSIDIVVAAIAEEKEYKKRLARERRRARSASETLTETIEVAEENNETSAPV